MVCSSCNQSRWIKTRFGKFANDLEWLTGWTPYRCHPCRRRGWYHTHRTPPALQDLRQAFARISQGRRSRRLPLNGLSLKGISIKRPSLKGLSLERVSIKRPSLPALSFTMPGGSSLTTAAGVVASFASGVWLGGVVFSGPSAAEFQSLVAASHLAPRPVVWIAPPIEAVRAAVAPPAVSTAGMTPAAVTPPVVSGLSPVVAATARVDPPRVPAVAAPPVRPAAAPKPVTSVAAARDRRDDKRKTVASKAPGRAPEPKAQPAAVRASVAAPKSPASPPLPRYHGSLVIRSEPRGALVSVDGQVVGATPLLLKGIRAGSRVVRIESEGYERWSSGARVVANQETAVLATLQRGSGH